MSPCLGHRCDVGPQRRATARTAAAPQVVPQAAAQVAPTGRAGLRASACACGGTCPRCLAGPVRDDPLREQQADAVARRIAPTLDGASLGAATPSGLPLPPAVAGRLASLLAIDASAVRLHAGPASAQACHALGARAFTVGNDIVFDRGQYRPDRPEGRHLIAHELAHVAQQRRSGARVQRSPYGVGGSADIHEPLADDYAREHGDPSRPFSPGGLQYTEGYRQWLQAQTAPGPRFLPPTFTQKDPLQQRPVAANGLTTYSINGQPTAGLPSLGDVIATIQGQLTPAKVVHSPGLVVGQTQCRFDPAQRIDSAAQVDELTPPPPGGWQARLPPAAVGAAAACPGKATVPVTLTDASGDPAQLAKLVHDSEMEHVGELRALHDRHFVPYHRFVVGLSATAGSAADCEARLRAQIADRDVQAATAFVLGDLAATRRYDDPASTHHGQLTPTVSPGCSAVTLTARQVNPPRPGAGPGNVMPVAPTVTPVDPARLAVSGSTLTSGATVVRTFASAADAATAMGVFAALGVTEIRRIGPVELLFAGAQAASGSLVTGLAPLQIDPGQYQVSAGVPNIADWVISQMIGARYFEIANFGASRDEAYAAAALMVGQSIARQYRIGAAGGAGMTFYTAA